jgi:hypothetical protein
LAEQLAHRVEIDTTHHQIARECVPKVVEPETIHGRRLKYRDPRLSDGRVTYLSVSTAASWLRAAALRHAAARYAHREQVRDLPGAPFHKAFRRFLARELTANVHRRK